MRPLGPATVKAYARILTRAFGSAQLPFARFLVDVMSWPESQRALLRAAIFRAYSEAGQDASQILAMIPTVWAPKTVPRAPTEDEALKLEMAARLLPSGKRALVLLPLALGLRAQEVLSLNRQAVKRGAESGELIVMRKGGKEQALPCENAKELLAELLQSPAAAGRTLLINEAKGPGRPKSWTLAGEILSPAQYLTQYHLFRDLVEECGTKAGLKGMRPHLLRHAFATRMARDGAALDLIQYALNHASIATTMRYVHRGAVDAAKFFRPMAPLPPVP